LNRYRGQHERKLECENELKIKLLINNIVTSSLLNWSNDFKNFNLAEFRGLDRFIKSKTDYLDLNQFFAF